MLAVPSRPLAARPPPLRCLVVDDEPLGRRALRAHIEGHPLLTLVGECRDGLEAAAALRHAPDGGGPVEAVFLDLEMPRLGGLELVRMLDRPPLVVVVTAYPEHALDGFEAGVLDYLVKPVPAGRFARAAGRLLDAAARAPAQPAPGVPAPGALFVHSDGYAQRVDLDGLHVVEAWGNYVRFHLAGRSVLARQPLRDVEAELPAALFHRTHRSFVVGLRHVERVGPAEAVVGGRTVPLSRRYRAELLARLGIAPPGV